MDENKIREAIKKVIENKELDITKLLTSDERWKIIKNRYKYTKADEYNQIKNNLLTRTEAELYDELGQLLAQKIPRNIEADIHLSDERKLEILKENHSSFYQYDELVKSIEDDLNKKEALKYLLDNNEKLTFIKYNEIIASFKNIDISLNTIDEYLEKKPEDKFKILNIKTNINELFKDIEIEKFKKFLKLLDKYKSIQEYKVLVNVPNKIEIFGEIAKLPNYKKEHSNLRGLIDQLDKNDSFEAYKILKENSYEIGRVEYIGLIKNISNDRKKEFIDILYNDIERKELEKLLASYLLNIKTEEARNEFKKYIIDDGRFDSLLIAKYLSHETMLNCLDETLIDQNKKNEFNMEKKQLVKDIIEYLETRNYDFKCDKTLVNCDTLIKMISEVEKLNEENIKKIIDRFGYQILKYLNNENITQLINLNEHDLEKTLNLFNEENLTIDAHKKDSIIEAVVQREFMFLEPNSYNIFSLLETQINNNNPDLKNTFDEVIKTVFDKRPKNLQEICKKNNITIEQLFEDIKSGKNIGILHEITQQYIEIKREEYSKIRTPEFIQQLDLDKKFKKEWILKKYVELQDASTIRYKISSLDTNLTPEQETVKNDYNLLNNIIEFKKNPTPETMNKFEKKNLKIFNELLNIAYENKKLNDLPKDKIQDAEYIYSFKKVEDNYLIEILSQLDISCLKDNILTQEENYNILQELLKKHKYLGIGTTFAPVTESIDLSIGTQAVAGLINYFYKLYNECEDKQNFIKNHTMTKLLEEGLCHELVSNKYATIIGEEDFKLIFSNTGKNRSSAIAQLRLNNVLEVIPKMYDKEYLTVPPINQTITLKNGKEIKVEIGQSLDFTNLSVGERTNACLRAKGAFHNLWEFILTNENGFNIIFKTPNDKFISRVSGIRNGNTVFENELRNSVVKEYTEEDLIEANQITTQLLEEYTKSNSPIENVIITKDYAMETQKDKLQSITTNREAAMYGLNFNYANSDTFEGIVLSNNGELKEIKLDNIKDTYVIENNTKTYYKEEALKKAKQINAINQLLNGVPIEDIEILKEQYDIESLSCISNNEYYILKQKDEVIETFIIDKYQDNKKVLEEIQEQLEEQNENSRNYH